MSRTFAACPGNERAIFKCVKRGVPSEERKTKNNVYKHHAGAHRPRRCTASDARRGEPRRTTRPRERLSKLLPAINAEFVSSVKISG